MNFKICIATGLDVHSGMFQKSPLSAVLAVVLVVGSVIGTKVRTIRA